MVDIRRTAEARKNRPFVAGVSAGVNQETSDVELQALLNALDTHKASADHDGRYFTEAEVSAFLNAKADKAQTMSAGDGLTGGGNLSADRSFAVGAGLGISVSADAVSVDLAENFNWTGDHTFSEDIYTKSLLPSVSDVSDVGAYNKLYRKIWGSELSAIIFSQYEQALLGGWLTISKGEGKLSAAVAAADTQIDLGTGAYAEGDLLVIRGISTNGSPQVEYIRLGTLVSGTVWNVARDVDGSSANDWPPGTVFGNWGQVGNGRVELNAYDEPRMSVYSHGAAIADFREQLRIGDLNGGWGYSSSVFGGAFGAYEIGKANITIDPTNGIRIRNYADTVIQLNGTTASFENFITLGANGGIRQGTGTWGSSFTGSAIWAEGTAPNQVMNIGGWNAGVKQWWGNSDGKLYAGAGNYIFDVNGLTIKSADYFATQRAINFLDNVDTDYTKYLAQIYATVSHLPLDAPSRSLIITIPRNTYYNGNDYISIGIDNVVATRTAQIEFVSIPFKTNAKINYYAIGGHTFSGPISAYDGVRINNDLGDARLCVTGENGVGYTPAVPPAGEYKGAVQISSFNYNYGLFIGGISGGNHYIQVKRGDSATYYHLLLQPVGGRVGIGTSAPSQALDVVGNVYVSANVSALTFTDRTPFYEGDALAELNNVKGKKSKKGKTEIDHKSLPAFVQVKSKDADGNEVEERDLGAMISILTVAIQQLDKKLNDLIIKQKGIA